MNFKTVIFSAVFVLACLTPAAVSAMGERPEPSRMCDMSWWTKKFVLSTRDGQKSETFKVPPRYMSAELERAGKVNTTLHIDAVLDTLEPRCQDDGQPVGKERALRLRLSINRRAPDDWAQAVKLSYADTELYQFEEIDIEGYPDFIFKASNRRPAPKPLSSRTYGDIPVYPKRNLDIPTFFTVECRLFADMKTLDLCKISFLYNEQIAVRATFPASELVRLEQIYVSVVKIIQRFHVQK